MPTTGRGLYYADGSASPNPIAISTSEANSGQTALDALALGEATPRFATAIARDAAFAAFPLAAVNGMLCVVDGTLMGYRDAAHASAAGWYVTTDCPFVERVSASTASITAGAFTAVTAFNATTFTNTLDTSIYFTNVTGGITVLQAGTYRVDGFLQWASAVTTGVRYMTVATSAANAGNAGAAGGSRNILVAAGGSDNSSTISKDLICTAGQVISVYGYTTTTSAMQAALLRVRKIG